MTTITKVGIVILTYNYGKYIDDLLDSLKAQTFQDFEITLVDDCSTDDFTKEKIKKLKYDKIKEKIFLPKNIGNAKCRLAQYEKLKNKYILDLSADDKLAPTFLEKTVSYLEAHPKCGAVSVNIDEYEDDFCRKPFFQFKYDKSKMCFPFMLARCYCLGSSLMRKQALDETDLSGGFVRYQDWDRYISMIEAGWTLGLIEEPLFLYRQHSDSLSHSTSKDIEMDVFDKILKKHKQSYQKYSQDVLRDIYGLYWEVLEGKNWLEQQYHNFLKENKNLVTENKKLFDANQNLIKENKKLQEVFDNERQKPLKQIICERIKNKV